MSRTPLYEALRAYAARLPLRLHMPGHKGRLSTPELSGVAPIDVTELSPTGNLYEGGEPFLSAQALWAETLEADYCQMLTGGSTQGLHTAFSLLCQRKTPVLVDREYHRSVSHALSLMHLYPQYLTRPWLPEAGVLGPVSPEAVDAALRANPEIRTVFVTSPTYYGVCSDIPALSEVVHSHNAKLLVDGAHGAHLPFLNLETYWGADIFVLSAHKTLPALGQAALLATRRIEPTRVRLHCTIYGTSSPSFPILASMDLARADMEAEAGEDYRRAAEMTARLRGHFPSLQDPPIPLDPCRLTLLSPDGCRLAEALEAEGIYCELADQGHVVCILTCADTEEDFARLEAALERHRELTGPCRAVQPPPLPEQALSPYRAFFAEKVFLPLSECEGRVAAAPVAPYPPGVPVVGTGERFGAEQMAYFRAIHFDAAEVAVVLDEEQARLGGRRRQ